MISINNKIYENVDKRVSWGQFSATKEVENNVVDVTAEAPIIKFNVDDSILIGVETTYPKECFDELKIGTKIDFTKHISDITYEDTNGWQSLIIGKYECELLKTNENTYNIKLNVKSDEFEEIEISIDEEINI